MCKDNRYSKLAVSAAATLVLLMPLAACGGGGTMQSFDVEKARVRGALSSVVTCVEGPGDAGGQYMECRSPAEVFRVEVRRFGGGSDKLEVDMRLGDNSTESRTMAWEFRHVLDAYGFGADKVQECLDAKYSEKVGASFSVSCSLVQGVGAVVQITQVKSV